MMLRNSLLKGWPAAGIALVLAVFGVLGCNSHKFQPAASMELSPVVVAYEAQRKDNYIKEVLITNDGVAASLELYGLWFRDQQRNEFTLKPVVLATSPMQDQTALKSFVARYIAEVDTTLSATYLTQGIIIDKPNVECKTDADCYCTPSASSTTCVGKLGNSDVGQPFACTANPLDVTKSSCVGYYKFINNAGPNRANANFAEWGGLGRTADNSTKTCKTNADCTALGADYKCLTESSDASLLNKCGTDIKLTFGTDFGLEHMTFAKVSKDGTEDAGLKLDTTRAAIWKAVDPLDGGLCLSDGTGATPTPVTYYGLNRCDQQALKYTVLAGLTTNTDAELDLNSFVLYPKSRANLVVMAMAKTSSANESRGLVEDGVNGKTLVFCNNTTKPVNHLTIRLDEQIAGIESAACIANGTVDESKLSINRDALRIYQLPVRLVYQVDTAYTAQAMLASKLFSMAVLSNATQSSESTKVQISLPKTAGGPPIPVPELDMKDATLANPEPLTWVTLTGKNSYNPLCEGGVCDPNTPDVEMTSKRKPYSYKWTITKYPNFAADVHLLKTTATIDSTDYVEGKGWDKDVQSVKMYATVSGEYEFELQVKDNTDTPSGPNAVCPGCPQIVKLPVKVKPSQLLHVEMLWDKGGQTDMDLFLVRYRDNGTFGYSASNSIVGTAEPIMPSCTTKEDCFGGALECGATKTCTNACNSNAICQAANPGWTCKNNVCQVSGDVIPCTNDGDCGPGKYCNPVKKVGQWILACTSLPNDAINDTIFYNNRDPRWGDYTANAGAASCTGSDTCIAADDNGMCGWDKTAPGKCALNAIEDDPTLDIDDVTGWGPENISVKTPKPGRYRIVARFWADGTSLVTTQNPNSYLTTSVRVYLMGESYFPGSGLTHDFSEVMTYWKVADIDWVGVDKPADNKATPICAGWTRTTCGEGGNAECLAAYKSSDYTCQERNWEGKKYCNSCGEAGGSPSSCYPTKICSTNADCAEQPNGATSCGVISEKYCRCEGAAEFAMFKNNPYANPAILAIDETTMNPTITPKRSIWCDSADDVIDAANGTKCSSIYAP